MGDLVIEADGGSRGNPGPAAYGAVVVDPQSNAVLAEVADHIGVATNNVAEYSGLVAGLREALDIDPHCRVRVRMDSKLVVEQMSGAWAIRNAALRDLALEARDLIPRSRVSFEWIPREANGRADALVNECLDGVAAGRPGRIRRRAVGVVASDDVVGQAVEDLAAAASRSDAGRPPNRIVGWATDLGIPTTTILMRHGATAFSLRRLFSGRGGADVPLVDDGIAQVTASAREIAARGSIDAVIASPLLRAQQSGRIVADLLDLPLQTDDDLAECSFGEWDGFTFAEVMERWPEELRAWLDSIDVTPPGGESFAACARRVRNARERIITRYPQARVVVISHVSPIKMLVADAIDAPGHSLYRMELAPGSLSTVSWWPDGNASLFGFAEAGHLRGIAAPDGT